MSHKVKTKQILKLLRRKGPMHVTEMSQILHVWAPTLNNKLTTLVLQGKVNRCYSRPIGASPDSHKRWMYEVNE